MIPGLDEAVEDRTRVGGRYVIRCRDVLRRIRLPVRLETGVGGLDSTAADLLAGLGHGVTGLFLSLRVRVVVPGGGRSVAGEGHDPRG
jgi:hypothetical protein